VRDVFLSLDADCDGVISPHELKAAVEGMGLSMSGPEFRKLWRRLDGAGEGKLTHGAFSKVVGPLIFPSSWGFASTMKRPGTPPLSPASEAKLAAELRRKVPSVEDMWAELDLYKCGRIRHSDFIQAMRMLGISKLGESVTHGLLARSAAPGNTTGEMTRDEFFSCMEHLLRDTPEPVRPEDPDEAAVALVSGEAALARAFARPWDRAKVLAQLAPFDTEGGGMLSFVAFKEAVEEVGAAAGVALSPL